MPTLTVTKQQLEVIEAAVQLYSRICIGQFDHIINHLTCDKALEKAKKTNRYAEEDAREKLLEAAKILGLASLGIGNELTSEYSSISWDLYQVIRHEFWKDSKDEFKDFPCVSSSVHLYTKDGDKIKVKLK